MKIFIVASENVNKLNYANALIALNDNLNICRYFVSEQSDGLVGEYKFYMDIDDIKLSFKNNVLFLIDYRDEYITGITQEDFDASDIVCMSMEHFNMIPDFILPNEKLIVWIDSKGLESSLLKTQLAEADYFMERIEENNIPLLYFIEEGEDYIAKTVLNYIDGDEETRQEILDENS